MTKNKLNGNFDPQISVWHLFRFNVFKFNKMVKMLIDIYLDWSNTTSNK